MDALSMVADEVALEGLDGITVPSLWLRLQDRKPAFPLKLDGSTKEFLWASLVRDTDLSFYELPQERKDVVLIDRYKFVDPETGIEYSQGTAEANNAIYPIHIVPENKDGIQGSCVFFKERVNVTKHIRANSLTALLSLEEALDRYARRLVIVASQAVRFRALTGPESDPELKLNEGSYCVLERVGRARWQGELQRDLHVCCFKTDPRKFHYLRMSLVKNGLVTTQSRVLRLHSGPQHSILLLLKRFHVNRRSRYDVLMEQTSNFLEQLPGHFATLNVVREHLNLNDTSSKHVIHHMRTAKLVDLIQVPLEDVDPSAGPLITKKGTKVQVRCMKLLKPYSKKDTTDDDEEKEDDEEEDETRGERRHVPGEGRIMEKDVLSQAYDIVLSSGTRGISQRGLGYKMSVGKLEARMLCRKLERDNLVKTFMEDEGRQRTTKYISHKCAGISAHIKQFAKEQERNKLLHSSSPQAQLTPPATPQTPSGPRSRDKGGSKTPSAKRKLKVAQAEVEDGKEVGAQPDADVEDTGGDGDESSQTSTGTIGAMSKPEGVTTTASSLGGSSAQGELSNNTKLEDEIDVPANEDEKSVDPDSQTNSCEAVNSDHNLTQDSVNMVEDIVEHQVQKCSFKNSERSHETYRLLRRKNLIVEAVHRLKVIEGLFALQKMINADEKLDGSSTKCCKKTILRLVQSLSRDGLLKLYTTNVIQDGISKKVDLVVHPSVQPSDDVVKRAIEQVRFRIASSYSVAHQQQAENNTKEQPKELEGTATKSHKRKFDKKRTAAEDDEKFKPTMVKGLSRTWGFQPKMHRLRLLHNFIWHLIYGNPPHSSAEQSPIWQNDSNPDTKHPADEAIPVLVNPADSATTEDVSKSSDAAASPEAPQAADSATLGTEVTLSGDEEEGEEGTRSSNADHSESMKVYVDENTWKRFLPPLAVHKDYGHGWAMMRDMLLYLPLSIFIQVTQINYNVDELEEYLSDPVKQHILVRALPAKMKRQLLYKRRYIFSFYENLQKLTYMGLLHFGPVEKFKEKDQLVVYLKKKITIVDTTSAEPHYWLIKESPDKPFERRQYTFDTTEDVENYWFDLMCVCLNTPLGVIRNKRGEEASAPSFVRERNVPVGMSHLLKGSREVCDDGSIPGDGKGAAGLHSEFFAHLKRNWWWTSHLLSSKERVNTAQGNDSKMRLRGLLTNSILRIALKGGETTSPRFVNAKLPLITEQSVEVSIEPASRNQQVVGGKRQKRKRSKKEVIKAPRNKKKREAKKYTSAHDEADHRALKMMTKQRVYWSVQEDSLMMLCSVASHLLNSKLPKPFIPSCVIRDLLQAEIEVSKDKTSLAVRRRTRYILKNPQTLLNYRICLAEVYQDKPLLKLLEEKMPANPDRPEDCAEAFSEYTRLLRQKFSSSVNPCHLILPDSKHQLFSWFKVCTLDRGREMPTRDTIRTTDDIHSIVLSNLIQSTLAMSNYQMKSCRSFQTFQIYSRYDQELLCRVFLHCRKSGLVSRRRVHHITGPRKNRALPILPMSYQLSQSYFRRFAWRFPYSLCTDVFRFLRSLISLGTDDRPATAFHHETTKRAEGGEKGDKAKEGKKAAGPTQQSEVAKDDETKGGQPEDSKEAGEKATGPNNIEAKTPEVVSSEDSPGNGPSSQEHTEASVPQTDKPEPSPGPCAPPQPSKEPPDTSGMLQYSLESSGGACAACLSLMTLGLLSIHVSIPKQMVVVDSSMVNSDFVKSLATLDEDDEDDDDGEENEGKKIQEVKAHQASHTKYLMMRGYCCPGIVKLRNLNTNDNIVVESCIMSVQLRNSPAHQLFDTDDSLPLNLTAYGPSLVPSVLTSSIRPPFTSSPPSPPRTDMDSRCGIEGRGYTSQDLAARAVLMRILDKAGQAGLTLEDLHQAIHLQEDPQSGRSRTTTQYMEELQLDGQALKVGGLGVRWVLMRHAEPWLLTSHRQHWSQESPYQCESRQKKRQRLQRAEEEPPVKKAVRELEVVEDAVKTDEGKSHSRVSQERDSKAGQEPEEQRGTEEEEQVDKVLNSDGEEDKVGQAEEEERLEAAKPEKRWVRVDEGEEQQGDSEDTEGDGEGPDGSGSVSFPSRPWRLVDGTLNRQVCKGMLEGVLHHIMSRPGLTQRTLMEHYRNVLQPVALLEIVQALTELGCVTRKTLVRAPKPSLFSRSAGGQSGTVAEDPDAVFYEPTISCSLRLALVLPNERHWNTVS